MKFRAFKESDIKVISEYYKSFYCSILDDLIVGFVETNDSHNEVFSIMNNCIFCDEMLIEEYQLSDEECYACISHEVGHYIVNKKGYPTEHECKEMSADLYAVQLGLASFMISVLNKINPDDELTVKRIKQMKTVTAKERFRELLNEFSNRCTKKEDKEKLLEKMREALIERNEGNTEYIIRYADPGKVVDLESCILADIRCVDADMSHYGM